MLSFLENLIAPVTDIIGKTITDKDTLNKIKADLQSQAINADSDLNRAASSIIIAEAQGESAVQRNWRPHLMYLIMGLLVWNGVAVPVINELFGTTLPILEAWKAIPGEMWTLLQIGLGGYIVGRTGEKIAANWKS